MSFYNIVKNIDFDNIENILNNVKEEDIMNTLRKDELSDFDFLTLLSKEASNHLERIAQRANEITLKHFGKAIIMYTPMYIANYCSNKCVYCSFNIENDIERVKLTLEEIEKEAQFISNQGFRHILVLTGESRKYTPLSYIKEAVMILRKYFDCISIEIYSLTQEEYHELTEIGVSGLTMYQETYNEKVYKKLHLKGPKKDYMKRLNTPENGAKAGLNSIGIGALLGLSDMIQDAFMTGKHVRYLQDKYPEVEYSVSLPRMRPHLGEFQDFVPVDNRKFVQILLAYRLYLPNVGINISTREQENFRDYLIPLGATSLSAGVSTKVGGHTSNKDKTESQFEISDKRSLAEIKKAIKEMGYQPVMKNWMNLNEVDYDNSCK